MRDDLAMVSSWGGKNKRDEKGNKKKIKNHLLPATKGKEGELGGEREAASALQSRSDPRGTE